jgi:hypothetical protein
MDQTKMLRRPGKSASSQNLTAVKIKMVPGGFQGKAVEPYQVRSKGYMRVVVTNDSDERSRVTVVDTYYQNRPQLFRDGRLLAYREEIRKLVRSKDLYPEFVRVGSVVFLEPHTSRDLEELTLSDWYGPLEPGSYRLINRHRFETGGPWSTESAELFFEVVLQRSSGN